MKITKAFGVLAFVSTMALGMASCSGHDAVATPSAAEKTSTAAATSSGDSAAAIQDIFFSRDGDNDRYIGVASDNKVTYFEAVCKDGKAEEVDFSAASLGELKDGEVVFQELGFDSSRYEGLVTFERTSTGVTLGPDAYVPYLDSEKICQ